MGILQKHLPAYLTQTCMECPRGHLAIYRKREKKGLNTMGVKYFFMSFLVVLTIVSYFKTETMHVYISQLKGKSVFSTCE